LVLIYRWLGFWVVRRAYRLLATGDPRPLRERLTGEAKRLLILAGAIALATIGFAVVAVTALVVYYG
jgi:hypothetical protein